MENLINISWLVPEIVLTIAVVVLLVFGVIGEKTDEARVISQQHKVTWLSVSTLLLVFLLLTSQYSNIDDSHIYIGFGIISVTQSTIGVKSILVLTTIAILLMGYEQEPRHNNFEWDILNLLALLGMFIIVEANDLLVFYLGIELLSLSLYALAASKRSAKYSTEAGLKYFILGALSSGILLFGIGLIYISTGYTSYIEIKALALGGEGLKDLLEIGGLMIVISLLFKLAAAPFHMWAPDVYEGAPTIVTAFFAIVPKIAILTALFNLLFDAFLGIFPAIQPLIIASALFSIIVGSIGALNQTKTKRLLAYSAISHIGFILLGFIPGTLLGLQSSFLYLIIYILMSINTFCVVLSLFRKQELQPDPSYLISQFVALSRFNPALAANFSLVLLSIAGIPPLAGFLSKFFVLYSIVDAHFYLLAVLCVIFSVIGSYYYLRIIKWIYFKHSPSFTLKALHELALPSLSYHKVSFFSSILIASTLYFILTLLIYPSPILFFTFDALFAFFA